MAIVIKEEEIMFKKFLMREDARNEYEQRRMLEEQKEREKV